MNQKFDALIGKKLVKILLDADEQQHLIFEYEDGTRTIFACVGDCCSICWISDILGITYYNDKRVPSTIAGYEFRQFNLNMRANTRKAMDTVYSVVFLVRTPDNCREKIEIIFRNSWDGYEYDGHLEIIDEMPACNWQEITENYP